MATTRIDRTKKERQARWRARHRQVMTDAQILFNAIMDALDRARALRLMEGLPDDDRATHVNCVEVARRLRAKCLVPHPPRYPAPEEDI